MEFLIRRGKKGRALYQPEQSPGKANQLLATVFSAARL
jgi:hypothetical protein